MQKENIQTPHICAIFQFLNMNEYEFGSMRVSMGSTCYTLECNATFEAWQPFLIQINKREHDIMYICLMNVLLGGGMDGASVGPSCISLKKNRPISKFLH